ncbi:putative sterigmatocystin biosynthesis peroxidase stcC [Colletotrichum higginsianum]|uniref:Putative sterigmatocystin biosynthesis peroxidase stcC n=1 Tax=Colletotrichum higginsianum TaxID=80884 RepID=A0A4T0WAE8_9PEZI|nr:putative sterigmatocystin biosynthesis peroxidase stcC [Colletotrichum higginsianum]
MPTSIPVGKYVRSPDSASRSPCPVVNALSNHGYLERNGEKIYMADLTAAMRQVGMSPLLGSIFAVPTYFEYHNPDKAYLLPPVSVWQKFWGLLMNPYSFFSYFGCWKPQQYDQRGKKYLNLENLASPGAIEHDVSLSRRDHAQKQGNNKPQEDLIQDMLKCSLDGETLTIDDLARFIKARIKQQLKDNPDLVYGPAQHQVNCGQIALMMGCFGDGQTIPVKYVRALFEDERLPIKEGWTKRTWWSMGVVEFFRSVNNLGNRINVTI